MRLPFAALALGLALGECGVAAASAWAARGAVGPSAGAGLGAAAVVFACAFIVLLPLDVLLRSKGARALGHGLQRALAPGGSATLATVLGASALFGGGAFVLRFAPLWMERMSPRFGVALSVLLVISLCAVLLLLAAAIGHRVLARPSPDTPRALALDRVLAVMLPACGAAFGLGLALSPAYASAPLCGGLAAGCALAGARRDRRSRASVLIGLTAALLSWFGLDRLPRSAAEVIAYRTPYASLLVGLGQQALDRDGDGAAARFLGGDCDDRNPRVRPGAREIAGNGVDENCNGGDAPRYAPPRHERASRRGAPSDGTRHDIVIILHDALRPDHLSLTGYARKTSPQLDALVREGVWFRNAYTTAPSTRFAMASLFTGRDVRRLKYKDTGGNNFKLLNGAPTLARRLRRAGYRTVGFPVTYVVQHNRGTGQGFQIWRTPWPLSEWRTVGAKKAKVTSDAVLAELERTPDDQPLLLFAHYYCTHDPYHKYPPYDFGDAPIDLYDSGIAHCDEQMGRVLDALRKRPNWERTAVFVVSDHGELFGEHGHVSHGTSLYEPDVRVLLAARIPGARPRVIDAPVQLHWVAPTVLELAGLAPDAEDDAVSLLDALLGAADPPRQPLFMFTELERGSAHYVASAVLDWPYKLIRDQRLNTLELYDVARDPRERRSLVDSKPELAGRLADLIEGYEAWAVP